MFNLTIELVGTRIKNLILKMTLPNIAWSSSWEKHIWSYWWLGLLLDIWINSWNPCKANKKDFFREMHQQFSDLYQLQFTNTNFPASNIMYRSMLHTQTQSFGTSYRLGTKNIFCHRKCKTSRSNTCSSTQASSASIHYYQSTRL